MDRETETVTIDARPEPIDVELGKTAGLVVDMQNDFGAKGGMFERAGIDITPIQQVVAPIGRVLAFARKAGMKVIYLKMEHRPDLSDAGGPDSPHRRKHRPLAVGEPVPTPDGGESRILIRDTWNTAIVTGCTTSVCVESTIRDAMYRDYSCVLLADCTAEPVGQGLLRTNHDASLLVVQTLFGWVSTSDKLALALSG